MPNVLSNFALVKGNSDLIEKHYFNKEVGVLPAIADILNRNVCFVNKNKGYSCWQLPYNFHLDDSSNI